MRNALSALPALVDPPTHLDERRAIRLGSCDGFLGVDLHSVQEAGALH